MVPSVMPLAAISSGVTMASIPPSCPSAGGSVPREMADARTLALAEIEGAEAALAALPDPAVVPALGSYQPYWAARAELLARCGAAAEAHQAYEMAIGLESDDAVRRFLRARQSGLPGR